MRVPGVRVGLLLAVAIVGAWVVWGLRADEVVETSPQPTGGQATSSRQTSPGDRSYSFVGDFDPYGDPFHGDGQKVSLEEAEARTSYDLAVPVTNEMTGSLTGIWIDPNEEVAFVWETSLRMWVDRDTVSEAVSAASYGAVVAEEPDLSYVLTEIQGHPALGHDKDAKLPPRLTDGKGEEAEILGSSLSIDMGGAGVQFVSPSHSLDQLISFGQQLTLETNA